MHLGCKKIWCMREWVGLTGFCKIFNQFDRDYQVREIDESINVNERKSIADNNLTELL